MCQEEIVGGEELTFTGAFSLSGCSHALCHLILTKKIMSQNMLLAFYVDKETGFKELENFKITN